MKKTSVSNLSEHTSCSTFTDISRIGENERTELKKTGILRIVSNSLA